MTEEFHEGEGDVKTRAEQGIGVFRDPSVEKRAEGGPEKEEKDKKEAMRRDGKKRNVRLSS